MVLPRLHFDTTPTSTFVCGDVINAQDSLQTYTVTSRGVTGGCEFTFDQDVQVITKADYDAIKEFKAAVKFINRVEVKLNRLEFFDDNGVKFELDTRVRDLELWVNGEQVLDMDKVRGQMPHLVVLSGEGLKVIKAAVKNREACSVHVLARGAARLGDEDWRALRVRLAARVRRQHLGALRPLDASRGLRVARTGEKTEMLPSPACSRRQR